MAIRRTVQFIAFYVLLFLAFRYLPKRGKTIPTLPAALLAAPGAAFMVWKINKQAN